MTRLKDTIMNWFEDLVCSLPSSPSHAILLTMHSQEISVISCNFYRTVMTPHKQKQNTDKCKV